LKIVKNLAEKNIKKSENLLNVQYKAAIMKKHRMPLKKKESLYSKENS